ncbi:hypothetical protein BDQ17DRAFT_1363159, partial [Cyathus striatus]
TVGLEYLGIQYFGSSWTAGTEKCSSLNCSPGEYLSFQLTGTGIYYLSGFLLESALVQFTLDSEDVVVNLPRSLSFDRSSLCSQNIMYHRAGMNNGHHTIIATLQGGSYANTYESCLLLTGFITADNIIPSCTYSPPVTPPLSNTEANDSSDGLSIGAKIGIASAGISSFPRLNINLIGGSVNRLGRDQITTRTDTHNNIQDAYNRQISFTADSNNVDYGTSNYRDDHEC